MAEFDNWPASLKPEREFRVRVIDLRQAALCEYPEFGYVAWPVPWWRRIYVLVLAVGIIELLGCLVVTMIS